MTRLRSFVSRIPRPHRPSLATITNWTNGFFILINAACIGWALIDGGHPSFFLNVLALLFIAFIWHKTVLRRVLARAEANYVVRTGNLLREVELWEMYDTTTANALTVVRRGPQ